MARLAERPMEHRAYGQYMRNIAIGTVILCGAVLWGYAVFSVAIRTL